MQLEEAEEDPVMTWYRKKMGVVENCRRRPRARQRQEFYKE